jgi:hypothetical protein
MRYTVADLKAGGVFVRHISCGTDQLRYNVAAHEFAVPGSYDLYASRYDEATQQVVDYQPPQPDADHEWNAQTRRWQKREAVLLFEQRRAVALARIDQLENKQARILRELEIDPAKVGIDGKTPMERLVAIDQEIEQLREVLADRP